MSDRDMRKKIQLIGQIDQVMLPVDFALFAERFFKEICEFDERFSRLVYAEWLDDENYCFKDFIPTKEFILEYILSDFDCDPLKDSQIYPNRYKNLSDDNKITVKTLRNGGWGIPILYQSDNKKGMLEAHEGGIGIQFGGFGGFDKNETGSIDLELPLGDENAFNEYDNILSLFKFFINFLDFPIKGSVYSFEAWDAYQQPKWVENSLGSFEHKSDYSDKFNIGWLTYINASFLSNNTLPDDIDFEELPCGGIIIHTTRGKLNANSSMFIEQAQRIHNVLEAMVS